MKSWQHLVLQFVLTVLQGANAFVDVIPIKWKPFAALVIGAAQTMLGQLMAQYNPDGTSAAVGYVKKAAMVLLAVTLTFGVAGCKDPYGACEKGAADIGQGIAAGMQTVDQLRVSGIITVGEETQVLGYLKFANDANGAFAVCAQQAHNAGGKGGAYTSCAQTFSSALANPAELALIHVTNPNAQATIQSIATAITTGLNTVVTALGGA